MKRKGISKELRFEVFKRDRFTCAYCGRRPPEVILVVDHVVPVIEGGGNAIDNLTTSCFDCNSGKGPRSLGNLAPALDELAVLESVQEMLERKELLRAQRDAADAERSAEDEALDAIEARWGRFFENLVGFEARSVRQFIRRLSLTEIFDAIDSTERRNSQYGGEWATSSRFKYFCGACWKKIQEREGRRGE